MNEKIYDLVIIGAGPVGLYSTFIGLYLKLNVICIEKDKYYGGQLTKLYPSKNVYDFPGYPAIKAEDLIEKLAIQAKVNDPDIFHNNTNVIKYEKTNDNLIKLTTSSGDIYLTKYVLFTVGPGAFEHVKVNDENLDDDITHNDINYVFKKDSNIENKDIVIFGGGDSAIDYAVEIKKYYKPKTVTLVHRSEKLRGISHTIEQLESYGIKVLLNTSIQKISKSCCHLQNANNETSKINCDYYLVQFGVTSLGSKIHEWNEFERVKNRFIVDEIQQTTIPNFFACGNCSYREYKIDMIITGIAEATTVLNYIHYQIKKTNKPEY